MDRGRKLMPYDTLPERLRAIIPSEAGQEIFRRMVNSQLAAGKSEEVAMASAWAALQRAGYDKDDDGMWTQKTQPTMSQVHVSGAEWDDEEKGKKPKDYYKGEEVEKQTYQPPESARNNARRVLRWREEHGDEVRGMTAVGWARARQLASGKPVSRATVARMSAFNRHRQNAAVAAEYQGTPWRDAGHVAWLGWGGTTGVDWARGVMGSLAKRMMNDDSFTTSTEAVVRSMDLGLNGDVHVHQTADGQAVYMPGADHETYLERMADLAGISDSLLDDAESSEVSSPDLLQRVISAILAATMEHQVAKSTEILKVDAARRIVWGWASVSTMKGELVTDRQGDRIAPAEMEKMADSFMRSARAAKAMHDGADVGEVIHSFPMTAELAKAFSIETDREGWITGTYIKSDAEWQKVLRGEYRGLSIGGRARRKESPE
jgi:cation transport regulator ChaB